MPLIYFIALIIIGQNILFQLFLAILLQEFDERSMIAEENKRREEELNGKKPSIYKQIISKLNSCRKKET